MCNLSDLETLVTALTAVPEYKTQLPPFYPILAESEALTLRVILAQKQLLRGHADQERDAFAATNKVIRACWQIPPTPLTDIPLGF